MLFNFICFFNKYFWKGEWSKFKFQGFYFLIYIYTIYFLLLTNSSCPKPFLFFSRIVSRWKIKNISYRLIRSEYIKTTDYLNFQSRIYANNMYYINANINAFVRVEVITRIPNEFAFQIHIYLFYNFSWVQLIIFSKKKKKWKLITVR